MSGPLPGVLAPVTVPMSWAYGCAVAWRNRRCDRSEPVVVGRPVISVGNITAGGAGKTPFVRWLATLLAAHGHRPAIAMRGYGAGGGEPGDEEMEYAERLPDVPVVADPDRAGALARFLPAHPEIDCVLLDDGFQHRRVARDLDLVLLDATRSGLDDRLLPAGYLREPSASLRRADGVIVTRAEAVDPGLAERIASAHGARPLAWSRHAWTGLRMIDDAGERVVAVDWLRGKRVHTLLGIGNAAAVRAQIAAAGAIIGQVVSARDHERYTAARLERLRRSARGVDAIVMTGKDWVKARGLIDWAIAGVPIVVPELAIEVFEGEAALSRRALAAVRNP